jgi:chromosome segregation ATPase
MVSEWNILEDILKNQKQIDAQIQSAEQELAVLDEKRKALKARIEQLKVQKQSIADEQLPFDRAISSWTSAIIFLQGALRSLPGSAKQNTLPVSRRQ